MTYIQTDRQTDIHTYIHTDRKTEPNYYIEDQVFGGNLEIFPSKQKADFENQNFLYKNTVFSNDMPLEF